MGARFVCSSSGRSFCKPSMSTSNVFPLHPNVKHMLPMSKILLSDTQCDPRGVCYIHVVYMDNVCKA